MRPIASHDEYLEAVEKIRGLQQDLWVQAAQKGTLDPDVLRLSQEIDQYIVNVQRYWNNQRAHLKIG
jgi:hypothetical protein